MLGAIVGDIVGSRFEFRPIKTKDFEFFHEDCRFTDDSVMTVAVARALMDGGERDDFAHRMKEYGRVYPDIGYGKRFKAWLESDSMDPYNSFGNGSAMRVSPVGWWGEDLGEVERYAIFSAEPTHNHPEGIKGARAVAGAVFLARTGHSKADIKDFVAGKFAYDLDRTLDEIRPTYSFDVTCQGSVPESIICFLESKDFEDAIRNAVSLGGDSDTMAAMAGSIAGAYYGISKEIHDKALSYLDENLKSDIKEFMEKIENK